MKGLKRIYLFVLAVVLAVSVFAFVGCEKKEGKALSGSMKIVITPDTQTQATVIDVDLEGFTDKSTVEDVMKSLKKAGKLYYEGSSSVGTGLMLTAIGVEDGKYILEQDDSNGKYLYTYTNVDSDKLETKPDAEYQAKTVEYEGQTLTESMFAVSSMSICDGAVIYFTYIIW